MPSPTEVRLNCAGNFRLPLQRSVSQGAPPTDRRAGPGKALRAQANPMNPAEIVAAQQGFRIFPLWLTFSFDV
jgi:hypothetical protein